MGYVRFVVNPPEQVKGNVITASQFGCKSVTNAKEEQLSTWVADVLIVAIRQIL